MHAGAWVAQRFRVEGPAGSGGMGVVYRAWDATTNGRVALKVLHGHEAAHADRFAREALLLAELRHPRIVGYVAHGATESGQAFIAMEWVEGETLQQRLTRGPLTVGEAVWMGEAVAEALAAAHDRGVIHRDLKPANLMLADGAVDRVKILDFGIAHADRADKLTATGEMLGTPGYMAPEQARGEGLVDARTDVYALGCVLFRSLAGRAVFEAPDALAVLLKVTTEPAPRLSSLRRDVPAALDELCASMLEKEPSRRPATAREVLGRLRGSQAAPTATAGAFTPAPTAGGGRTPLVAAGIALAALVIGSVAAAGWMLTRDPRRADADETEEHGDAPSKKRSSKTPPNAPTTPAPDRPDEACDELKCQPFTFPDPSNREPLDALAVAVAMAKSIDPNPQLWRIEVGRMDSGVVDGTLPGPDFVFQVGSESSRPGADGRRFLEVRYRAGRFEARYGGAEPYARPSKLPTCKLKDAWRAAVESGLAANAVASVEYADDEQQSLGGVWSFAVAHHAAMHRHVDGQTCKVVKKGF
jgi:hypothetical protein